MRYQGGKSKTSRQIAHVIETVSHRNQLGGGTFVSLFCGSCVVESKVTGYDRMILNDKHKYLIALLQGVQNSYELPDSVTEEQYKYIRQHKDDDPVLAGFVGFGCSFGGKWFGGYAKGKDNRNYAQQCKTSLLRDMQTLMNAEFICKDYRDVELPDSCVIYADPPYNNTTGYRYEKFNSDEFWQYAREVSQSHMMFISEQTAPDDFVAIWERPLTRTLDWNKNNQFSVVEKVFLHKDSVGMWSNIHGTAR